MTLPVVRARRQGGSNLPLIRGPRLLAAARNVTSRFAAPLLLLTTLPSIPERTSTHLGIGVLLAYGALGLVLWYRRSPYALWGLLVTGLGVHAILWPAAPRIGFPVRFEYAAAIDRWLGMGTLPTVRLQQLYAGMPGILDWLAFLVYATFFVLPLAVFLVAWNANRRLATRYGLATVLLCLLSLTVMIFVPTAPPWMAAQHGLTPPITRIAEVLVGAANHARAASEIGGNEVAAMPSIHAGMAMVIALTLRASTRRLARLTLLYPAAMGLALIYLGEHYLVDVVAGFGVAFLAWYLASPARLPSWLDRIARRPAIETPGAGAGGAPLRTIDPKRA